MGLFNKKKKTDDAPNTVVDPIEQVFGAPTKKPAAVPPKVTTVTPVPAQKPVQKPVQTQATKQVAHTPTQAYGYGPEEVDIDLYGPYDDPAFPNNHISGATPYRTPVTPINHGEPADAFRTPATPLKPGEKPEPWYKTYTPKPLYEKRSAIILVVEASLDTVQYKAEISRLINKIVTDNSDEFFLFIRFGNATKYSELIKGDKLKDKDVVSPLLTLDENAENKFDIYATLTHINSFIKDHITLYKTFDVDLKQYMLEDVRIIFIGTARTDECKHNPRILLRTITKTKKVKAVKYFCLKDVHTVKAAALGFPVIGHIESNFYK